MANFVFEIPAGCLPCCADNPVCPDLSAATVHTVLSSVASCACANSGFGDSSKITFTGLNGSFDLAFDAINHIWTALIGSYSQDFYSDPDCVTLINTNTGTFYAELSCDGSGNYLFLINLDGPLGPNFFSSTHANLSDVFTNIFVSSACSNPTPPNIAGGKATFAL